MRKGNQFLTVFEKEGRTIPTSTHYKADLQDRKPISDNIYSRMKTAQFDWGIQTNFSQCFKNKGLLFQLQATIAH